MLTVSSTAALTAALRSAERVSLTAYVLRPGAVLHALEAAGDRGARVRVRLEPQPFGDDGSLRAGNDAAVAELRAHGVDAGYRTFGGPLHMKAAQVDGEVFLDDRNWPDDGRDTILRSSDADDVAAIGRAADGFHGRDGHLETRKSRATDMEARMILDGKAAVDCESESFGYSFVYAALKKRAQAGAAVRLLVSARELAGPGAQRETAALRRLASAGVTVRAGTDDEKICVTGGEAWAGSANATAGEPSQVDWGMRTRVPSVVAELGARFERNWAAAEPLLF